MKPFLKWAGNKYPLIERIEKALPEGKHLIEPFVGSGAVFLNIDRFERYTLADSNADLIHLYQTLQKYGDKFVAESARLFTSAKNSERQFYLLRNEFNSTKNKRRKSALFLYLNRHGFNGLCRYNQKGEFNVPFGRYIKPYFPEKEMHNFYSRAKFANFIHADFKDTMNLAKRGDIVYCDPPYAPLTPTASFTAYTSGRFGDNQQKELVRLSNTLTQKGVSVVISNHDIPFVRHEYKKAHAKVEFEEFKVQRFISCDGSNRRKVAEILAIFSAPSSRRKKAKAR